MVHFDHVLFATGGVISVMGANSVLKNRLYKNAWLYPVVIVACAWLGGKKHDLQQEYLEKYHKIQRKALQERAAANSV